MILLSELSKSFDGGATCAVRDVSLDVGGGETLVLLGASGCGKTTTLKMINRLIEPSAGRIVFAGRDITALSGRAMRPVRREMQVVFQDPFASLNPRRTVGEILTQPFAIHGIGTPAGRRAEAEELLALVGLRAEHLARYPHEFSGGQRQRIGIARAIALRPKFVVCDEAVSALDVSIQAQVLNLLLDLQDQLGLTYLFISHDLSVVEHISDRVAVMYLGHIVEIAAAEALYAAPLHPYTEALLAASPVPDPAARRQRIVLQGDVPSPLDPPRGCAFHTRCPHATEACRQGEVPPLREVRPGHAVRCLRVDEIRSL